MGASMKIEADDRFRLFWMHAEGLNKEEIDKTIAFMQELWAKRFDNKGETK